MKDWHDAGVVDKYLEMSRSEEVHWYERQVNWPAFRGLFQSTTGMVLDFGCGAGVYTDLIAEATGGTVEACDVSEKMLEAWDTEGEYATFVWDGVTFDPELAGRYELIATKLVLMSVPDLASVARGFFYALRPGGTVAVSVIHPQQTLTGRNLDYFSETSYEYGFRDIDATIKFYYRSVSGWLTPFLDNGFVLTSIIEPEVPLSLARNFEDDKERWTAGPKRLNFRLRKPERE